MCVMGGDEWCVCVMGGVRGEDEWCVGRGEEARPFLLASRCLLTSSTV